MTGTNILTGIGCERDSELQRGRRHTPRAFLLGSQERREYQLGLTASIRHYQFAQGDLVSLIENAIGPLSLDLPFGGIIDAIGEDVRGRYMGSLVVRGIAIFTVEGLTEATPQGALVYAIPTNDYRCRFTLAEHGVLIGEVTNRQRNSMGDLRAHVGLRTLGDTRGYSPGSIADPFEA